MNPTSPGAGRADRPQFLKVAPRPAPAASMLSEARSELWVPRAALAPCVRAVFSRDTRSVALDDAQRYSHFPATPACSIVWYLSGSCDLLAAGHRAHAASPREPVARVALVGPFTRPSIVWNPGPMHAFVVMLMPDALALLTGLDPSAWIDRVLPAHEVLGEPWRALFDAVDGAGDDEHRVRLVESFLLPRWRGARPVEPEAGRSARQAERRIKQWTGQTLRALRGMGRSEQAFFETVAAHDADGGVDWSEVADAAGYADQAHMCRQTRRVTGFAPEELRRRIAADESFWVYRLWADSHGLPEDADA
jgi:AraC-like DNA-binding protein